MRRFSMTFYILLTICVLSFRVALAQQSITHAPSVKPAAKAPVVKPSTPPVTPAPEVFKGNPPVTIENDFARVVVNGGPDELGRFSIDTSGGDPAIPKSKDKRLIYGGKKPWTSYTTLRLDGQNYVVGGPTKKRAALGLPTGKTLVAPFVTDNQISYSESFGEIEVTQKLGFVRGMDSRMLDTVGISYTLTNNGATKHDVGLRMLLDTMCGDNDGAPMRVGRDELKVPTMYTDKEIPDFWLAYDDLTHPTVVAQGTMRGGGTTPPNNAIFADWGTLADDPWIPKLDPAQGFNRKGDDPLEPDTAMALLWQPVTLEPGKSVTYISNFGIGYVNVVPGVLTLGLAGPSVAEFKADQTVPITVTGYMQNTGKFDAKDIVMTLKIPDGLELVNGSSALQTEIKLLKTGESVQGSWVLRPTGKGGGQGKLDLAVTSSNIEANHTAKDLNVIVPKSKFAFLPEKQSLTVEADEHAPVMTKVVMNSSKGFYGYSVTIQYDPQILHLVSVSRGTENVVIGSNKEAMALDWGYDRSKAAQGIITITGKRKYKDQQMPDTGDHYQVNLGVLNFYTWKKAGTAALAITDAKFIGTDDTETPVDSKDLAKGEITVDIHYANPPTATAPAAPAETPAAPDAAPAPAPK